jgi:hypothetical protein
LVKFSDLRLIATATDEAVVRLVEVAGSCKLGAGDAGEWVEDQAVADFIDDPVDYEEHQV